MTILQQDIGKFDAVCMATALHTLTCLCEGYEQYVAGIFGLPEVRALMHAIGECLSYSVQPLNSACCC